jgi:hypothetical protein
MTMIKHINDKDLIEKGGKILFKELGYTDAIRFLSISGNIREERGEIEAITFSPSHPLRFQL